MTTFTMSANLTADKRLEFVSVPLQNQGENKTTSLQITVPSAVSGGNDFYLEFACPHGRKYISTLLEKQTVNGEVVLTYQMPSCLFADEGIVYVQLTARNQSDETLVFKSKLSGTSAFFVNKAINACDDAHVSMDFFTRAMHIIDAIENEHVELDDVAKPDGEHTLLDSHNKISLHYLPQEVFGKMQYNGVWNASSGVAQLAETLSKGHYYVCSQAGIYAPDGTTVANAFGVGDWAVFNGVRWDKIDNTDSVTTVNGKIGAVETYAGDYSEATAYARGDIVNTQNGLYICITNAPAGTPVESVTHFKPMCKNDSVGTGVVFYQHNVNVHTYCGYDDHSESALYSCVFINTSPTPIETKDALISAVNNAKLAVQGNVYIVYYGSEEAIEPEPTTYQLQCMYKYSVNDSEPAVYGLKYDVFTSYDAEPRYFVYDDSEYRSADITSCTFTANDFVEQIGGEQ